MTVFFYVLVSLCLVIIKTTLIPGMPLLEKFYDLLIPIVIYLSLFRPVREGAPLVFFFGLMMDSLCGGPLGLYLTTYIWIYAGMRWASQFLRTANMVLLTIAVALGVTFECLVLLIYMLLLAPSAIPPEDTTRTVAFQIAWALVTGPVILLIIGRSQKQLDVWKARIFPDWLDMNRE
jgi:cell shape-determining protein MreD